MVLISFDLCVLQLLFRRVPFSTTFLHDSTIKLQARSTRHAASSGVQKTPSETFNSITQHSGVTASLSTGPREEEQKNPFCCPPSPALDSESIHSLFRCCQMRACRRQKMQQKMPETPGKPQKASFWPTASSFLFEVTQEDWGMFIKVFERPWFCSSQDLDTTRVVADWQAYTSPATTPTTSNTWQ